jgi:poly(hydroxyalkanoate) granule-associated protein
MADRRQKTKVDQSTLDMADKIWMAGLGALHTAEQEGSKLFKSLVDKGIEFQDARREMSQKQLERVGRIVRDSVGSVKEKIADMTQQKDGVWDKLHIEETLASVIKSFGVATRKEIDSLNRKIDALSKTVREGNAPSKKASARKAPVAKTSAKKAPVKKAAPKASK